MDPQAEVLLRKAVDDRAALEFDLPEGIFGFHAQQAYEKLMKAVIASRNIRFERTHDLGKLLAHVESIGEGPLPAPSVLASLQSFAVDLRYEDENVEKESLDREKVRQEVDTLIAFVTNKLTDKGPGE